MKKIVCDVETTTYNKGNPFDRRNCLVALGIRDIDEGRTYIWFYPNKNDILEIQEKLDNCLFIAHNAKFDIHWCLNLGLNLDGCQIHCTQIAEFMLNSQNNPYPSLNEALEKYGLPLKLDVVKTEYWDKGVSTEDIPHEVLTEYLEYDLTGTEEVFKRQYEQLTGKQV